MDIIQSFLNFNYMDFLLLLFLFSLLILFFICLVSIGGHGDKLFRDIGIKNGAVKYLLCITLLSCFIFSGYELKTYNDQLNNIRLNELNTFDVSMPIGGQVIKKYRNEKEFSESNEYAQRAGYQIIQVSRNSSIFNPKIIVVYQKR